MLRVMNQQRMAKLRTQAVGSYEVKDGCKCLCATFGGENPKELGKV